MEKQRLDWNALLVRFFVDNSRLVWLIIVSIILGGVFSVLSLRREGFPQISPKIVFVQTVYPGAAASQVEIQVTKEIESAIKDVKGLKEFSSTSGNSFSNVVITLEDNVDTDQAIQEVQSKVQAVRSSLPQEAEVPRVSTFSTSGPSYIYGITRGSDVVTSRDEALVVANEIQTIRGVKSAKLMIDRPERIVISYRPADLASKGIALGAITQAIQSANVDLPIATLDVDQKEQAIVLLGSFNSIEDMGKLIVGTSVTNGQPVLLNEVATIQERLEDLGVIERFGYVKNEVVVTKPGVLLSVELTKEADVIKSRETILQHLQEQQDKKIIASDTEIIALSDQAKSTADQVREVVEGAFGAKKNWYLLGGLQLLFLAMLLFVNWRAALLAALSIPLSLGVTFISLKLFDIHLNTIVLFSLILVLGLVVDPAVVMVESIQRYRDLRYKEREAVVESGRRYGASLFMAVLTSLIVFFPFGVVSGIFGEIIKYIPLTVIPALVASYFVPIALLPLLARWILPTPKHTTEAGDENDGLSRLATGVMRINAWILARRMRQVILLITLIVLVGLSGSLVARGSVQIVQFTTPEDNPSIMVRSTFVKGITFADRDHAAQEIEGVLMRQSAVSQFFYMEQDRDHVALWIDLKEKEHRTRQEDKSKAVVRAVREKVSGIRGLDDVIVQEAAVGPPESDYQIQTQVYATSANDLEKAAKDIGAFLAKQNHVVRVDDGFTNRGESTLQIELNRDAVQRRGLSSIEVGQQLKSLLDETKVGKLEGGSDSISKDIFLINEKKLGSVEDVERTVLATRTVQSVRVGDVARVRETTSADVINRFNGSRFVNVRARVDEQKNIFAVQQALDNYLSPQKIEELKLISRENRGEFEDIAKSFSELGIALVIAILLTYLVLVLQFKSFTQPGIMLFTIPLSFIGVFPALAFTNSNLGFLELLGVTILVGIVENVAIFLIDYANQLRREQNISAKEAIIQASGVRFRPIVLTKLVALGGLLPLAIESDFWRGLAVVIIAGIGVSGFLSLAVIPVLYVWIEAARERTYHKLHRSALT